MDSSKDQKTKDVLAVEDGDSDREENVAEDHESIRKIFVGGVPRSTSESDFTKHFSKYGEITDSVIMKDRLGNPRGFGFVTYADPSVLDKVIQDTHVLDGKTVEIKRTIPRENSTKGPKNSKIFVGGIPTSVTEDQFKDYFSKFGKVVEHQIMQGRSTGRSRGFGFVTFDSEQAVEEIMSRGPMLELGGKQVEIKKAEPKKPLTDAGPVDAIHSRPPNVTGGVGGFGDSFSGVVGAGYGSNPYSLAGIGVGLPNAGPVHAIDSRLPYLIGGVGGFGNSYSGVGGAGYGSNPYRSAGTGVGLPDAGPVHAIDSRPPYVTGGVGGFGDSYSGVGGAGYGSNPYRSAGTGVGVPDAGPVHAIDSKPPNMTGGVGGFGDSYSGVGVAGFGSNLYRSAGTGVGGAGYGSNLYKSAGSYADKPGGYAGYGGPDYGKGYGGYSGGSLGGYMEDASRRYGGRGGSHSEGVGYDSVTLGGYGGADGYGAYGGRNESRVGGPYGSGEAYGSGRGAYGGSSLGRYHPYAR